jgi:hypothetical protein
MMKECRREKDFEVPARKLKDDLGERGSGGTRMSVSGKHYMQTKSEPASCAKAR